MSAWIVVGLLGLIAVGVWRAGNAVMKLHAGLGALAGYVEKRAENPRDETWPQTVSRIAYDLDRIRDSAEYLEKYVKDCHDVREPLPRPRP